MLKIAISEVFTDFIRNIAYKQKSPARGAGLFNSIYRKTKRASR